MPLGLRAATRVGEAFNMLLPTPRMVDMIYRAAELKLAPSPMSPGAQMTSTDYLLRHNQPPSRHSAARRARRPAR